MNGTKESVRQRLGQTGRDIRTRWIPALWPQPQRVNARERWRICIGAFFGIFITGLGAFHLNHDLFGMAGEARLAWLVAPLGASAVLVFAVPSSPLAQPWSVLGGNTLSALVGIACVRWVPDPMVAAGLAVAGAIALMLALRCLHPPGGASALLMALGGMDQFSYAWTPVFVDSALLVVAGLMYNNLTGRHWPHGLVAAKATSAQQTSRFAQADLDAALARYNQVVAMSEVDMAQLLLQAEASAYQRHLGDLRCGDIMTVQPLWVTQAMPLREAWRLMRRHHVKALPVTDVQRRLVGIVTTADFMKQIDLDAHEQVGWRLRSLLNPRRRSQGQGQRLVGEIMARHVRTVRIEQPVVDVIAIFSEHEHRHLPVVDEEGRVQGVLTQSDVLRALYEACKTPASAAS